MSEGCGGKGGGALWANNLPDPLLKVLDILAHLSMSIAKRGNVENSATLSLFSGTQKYTPTLVEHRKYTTNTPTVFIEQGKLGLIQCLPVVMPQQSFIKGT